MALIPSQLGTRKNSKLQFGRNANKVARSKLSTLPDGSGFDRFVQRRADTNNLPGAVNHFGDRITGPSQVNKQVGHRTFGGRGRFNANPRAGQTFKTGLTQSGDTVHIYKGGQRIVVPKKRAKFQRY